MSTPCPYRIIKGDDGLSVKVEWDVHYLTDEQIGTVRKHVAELQAENAKLRKLAHDLYIDLVAILGDGLWMEPYESEMMELGVDFDG